VSQKLFNTSVYLKEKYAVAKEALLALVQVNQQKQREATQLIARQEESSLQALLANIE